MRVDAVVVAAGRSTRFGEGDKLLANLNGRPVIAWSLAALGAAESVRQVAIVGREDLVGALEAIGREVLG
ncbi:MAG: NTP transferase domain-containing protein, partial [Dehalococcoidia bacterium]|nr:NTP transferase domain-containing protein [Dehalococcoidia bacterium]